MVILLYLLSSLIFSSVGSNLFIFSSVPFEKNLILYFAILGVQFKPFLYLPCLYMFKCKCNLSIENIICDFAFLCVY